MTAFTHQDAAIPSGTSGAAATVLPGESSTANQRWRRLRRRGRAAAVRRWLGVVSVTGGALVLMTLTLFSLIAH